MSRARAAGLANLRPSAQHLSGECAAGPDDDPAAGPGRGSELRPPWIHFREYRFLLAVLTAFGILVVSGQLAPLTALFAGYTVDSVSDLVLQRFNGAVSTQAAAVRRVIAGTSG